MKPTDVDVLGEELGRRKLSAEDVQVAVDRAWRNLGAQADTVPDEVLRDLQPFAPLARRSSSGIWLAAAAAVLAAAVLLSLWPRGPHARLENGDRVAFGEVFRSPDGAALTLPDGSRVEVRSGAELTLVSTDDGMRIRLNSGTIVVTAAKQLNRHLYVQTRDMMVSVVGTVFLVEAGETGSRVVVIEGKVRVEQGGTEKVLIAGEQLSTVPTRAVTQGPTAVPPAVVSPPEFEVEAIRPSEETHTGASIEAKNERVTIKNMNLRMIIRYAYDVKEYQLSGPGVLTTDRYSVQAKAPSGTPNSQLNAMLQAMLADRFKLALKRETRDMPVYALVQAKDGIKIKEMDANQLVSSSSGRGMGAAGGGAEGVVPGMVTSSMVGTMETLANNLSRYTDRPVLDRTGLTGRYTLFLGYVPESALRDGVVGPSLDMALERLGLKLNPITAPLEFLEVEHIEKPSPN
jgi:uncharacterized protein (TIGR03435 family)